MRSIKKENLVVGVDEVGRGPVAGPVAVGVVMAQRDLFTSLHDHFFFTDSKKMTPLARERVFKEARKKKISGELLYTVSFVSASVIDAQGINPAISKAVVRSLSRLGVREETPILLDGGLKAPLRFIYQETIKGGDGSELPISLASIIAKVLRDRRMVNYEKMFPGYDLSSNKGYGTLKHIEAIKKFGTSKIHRSSYLGKYGIT